MVVGILCMSDPAIVEGLCAFTSKQTVQYRTIHAHCKHLWWYVAEYVALGAGDVVPSEAQAVNDNIAILASE
jgi:hypothetical protein